MEPVNVSAIIVTRGNVDLSLVLDSLPDEWERLVWNNGVPTCTVYENAEDWRGNGVAGRVTELSVYGRYAAIEYASHDLIYVQDDDVIVSDPQAIVERLIVNYGTLITDPFQFAAERLPVTHVAIAKDRLVANMPQEFRHDGYTDSCLVGFGSCFHRDLPGRSFSRFMSSPEAELLSTGDLMNGGSWFNRTCDVVFTTLVRARVLVDVPITHREFASDPDRMWKQPNHVSERARMLDLARAVRDGRKS